MPDVDFPHPLVERLRELCVGEERADDGLLLRFPLRGVGGGCLGGRRKVWLSRWRSVEGRAELL
eukprot:1943479-Heterocapsa_arctica.AAC.1